MTIFVHDAAEENKEANVGARSGHAFTHYSCLVYKSSGLYTSTPFLLIDIGLDWERFLLFGFLLSPSGGYIDDRFPLAGVGDEEVEIDFSLCSKGPIRKWMSDNIRRE